MRYILNILKWPFGWLNSLTFGFFFFFNFSKRLCHWTLSFFSTPHFWQPFLIFNIFLPSGEAKNFEINFWLLFVEQLFPQCIPSLTFYYKKQEETRQHLQHFAWKLLHSVTKFINRKLYFPHNCSRQFCYVFCLLQSKDPTSFNFQ